jgi:hypothetical protein
MIVDSASPRVSRAAELVTEIASLGRQACEVTPAEIRDIAKKNLDTLVVVF